MKQAFLGPAQQWELAHKPANLLALIYPNRGKKANVREAARLHFPGTRHAVVPVSAREPVL
jgi:hypothetical protein